MIPILRRGACPSLSEPMETGDGLLARLTPRHGRLSAAQLNAIAQAAGRHGNGMLEITSRGSLQIRGLSATSSTLLAEDIGRLGIEPEGAPEIRIGPFAGLAPDETADPRPVADNLRRRIVALGLAARLAPKLSIVVDGGGLLHPGRVSGDIRLDAVTDGQGARLWTVSVGGDRNTARRLGEGDETAALQAVLILVERLAATGRHARGRDLSLADLSPSDLGLRPVFAPAKAAPAAQSPVGLFPLRDETVAAGFAPAFGQVAAEALAKFCETAGEAEIALAPGRGFVVTGLATDAAIALQARAAALDMVTDPDDSRLLIDACAGAPACASAHLATRPMARAAWRERGVQSPVLPRLYLAGCAKQCGRPAGPLVAAIGGPVAAEIVADGFDLAQDVRNVLERLARRHGAYPPGGVQT